MNDEMEGIELHKILSSVLHTKYEEKDYKKKLQLIETTINTHLRYQLSFSATLLRDDISQWRAYTGIGRGVAIEFEDGFITDPRAKKLSCLYDEDEKRREIIKDKNLKSNDERTNEILKSAEGTKGFIQSVVSTLSRFKNASFKPEHETRWVISLDGLSDSSANIEFRPHRLGLTLYEQVSVDLSKVRSVTIGPQVPEQNLLTIEDFLIAKECSGGVRKSEVTLRY